MTPERIKELRELLANATPGPWRCTPSYGIWAATDNKDAALIVAAVNELGGLLDAVEPVVQKRIALEAVEPVMRKQVALEAWNEASGRFSRARNTLRDLCIDLKTLQDARDSLVSMATSVAAGGGFDESGFEVARTEILASIHIAIGEYATAINEERSAKAAYDAAGKTSE